MLRLVFCSLHRCPRSFRPLMVLEDEDHRLRLTLEVSPADLGRLQQELAAGDRPALSVYATLVETVSALGGQLEGVFLDSADGDLLEAFLQLSRDGAVEAIPCPPTDALALALRTRLPILASERILARATPQYPGPLEDPQTVRRWLDGLSPADFGFPDGPGVGEERNRRPD